MNEEFLKQAIAELNASYKADLLQTEDAFGTTIIMLILALSDHIDPHKLQASILNYAALAQKKGFLNQTAQKLIEEIASVLEEKQQATQNQGQSKH